jgi:hypothetical protein
MAHALIAIFNHPRETWEQQKPFLHQAIIPMVKKQPGFVAGHWSYDAVTSKSYSIVTWSTEADARAMLTLIRDNPKPPGAPDLGVRLESAVIAEIMGEATS